MTDWSQFKPADETAAELPVDWSQFEPAPKLSLFERAKALFAADIPALDRPATPEQVAARPPGLSPQEMADGSIAPWRAKQIADAAAYGNTNRSPELKPFTDSTTGNLLRRFDRKPLDNSLFGAVTETAGDASRGVAKAIPALAKSGYGVLQAGAEVVGADSASSFARAAQDAGADWLTQLDNPNGDKLVTGAFQSLGTAIAGGAVGGTAGAIGLAVGQTAADKYNELRKGGIALTDSLEGATVHGVAEYLGERIGMKSLARMVEGIASKTGMPPMVALKEALKQQGEEQVTLAIQSAYDKLGSGSLRGDMTLDDYLDDVVTTAQQTAIMTAAAAGGGRIARTATQGAQLLLKPGLAAPRVAPEVAAFAPMTDAANIATAPAAQPTPINLMERQRPPVAPIRVEDQPTAPMTPEQILSAPTAAPRIDVNNADAVLAQLGLGQPSAPQVAPTIEPIAPVLSTQTPAAPLDVAPAARQSEPATAPEAANEPQFRTRATAAINARRTGGTVAEVPGGFAVLPQPTSLGATTGNARPVGTRGTSAADVLASTPTDTGPNVAPPGAPPVNDTNPPSGARAQTQAPADQAPAPARSDAAAPAGVPAAGGAAAVEAGGVAQDADDRVADVTAEARRWFTDDAEYEGRDYAAEYGVLNDRHASREVTNAEFAQQGEALLAEHAAARKKAFAPMADVQRDSERRRREQADLPDTRSDAERAFDRNPESALNALSDDSLEALGKALNVRRGKKTRNGFVEAMASQPRSEVRAAYLQADGQGAPGAPKPAKESASATPAGEAQQGAATSAGASVDARPTPAIGDTPLDPFSNDFAALEGKTVEQQVTVAETGQTATLRMDAAKAMRDIESRQQALAQLKTCIGKRK